jgi:hypothetical protein
MGRREEGMEPARRRREGWVRGGDAFMDYWQGNLLKIVVIHNTQYTMLCKSQWYVNPHLLVLSYC